MEDILEACSDADAAADATTTTTTNHGRVQRKNLVMVLRLRTQALDAGGRGPSANDMRGVLRVFEDVMTGVR